MPEKLKRVQEIRTAPTAAISAGTTPWRKFAVAGVLFLGAVGLAGGFWFMSHRTMKTATGASPVLVGEKRIAVLPFKPLVAENRDQILELGMADTLITKLSNSRKVIVPSLNSVRKYNNLEQDPVLAGRELQANSVLEGNVQKVGDRIRVTARLINVADGSSLWAETFDEKFTDLFAVQDVISQKVADALALRLSGEEKNRLTKRYTENLAAYQLYLTGRYHAALLTPPEIREAMRFYQQAIDLDPSYALAYFGLAEANRSLAINADVPSRDCLPQAKAAANKALEIDESLAEAHASLSFSLIWFDWDWSGAEKEAKRAILLNPNSAMAHFSYAHVLSALGRHDEAVREGARAVELEPVFSFSVPSRACFSITPGAPKKHAIFWRKRSHWVRISGSRTSRWAKFLRSRESIPRQSPSSQRRKNYHTATQKRSARLAMSKRCGATRPRLAPCLMS
jgi:TolB-like protein